MRGFRERKIPNTISFRYVKDKQDGKIIARPRLEMLLRNGDRVFRLVMLVDSGADTSFIPLEVAEILELKLGEVKTSRSASGPFETTSATCQVELVKGGKPIPLGEMLFVIPTKKLDDENITSYALLGRGPFFNYFDITFRENDGKLILRKPKGRPRQEPVRPSVKQLKAKVK